MKTICAWDNVHCIVNNTSPSTFLAITVAVLFAVMFTSLFND